MKLRDMMRKKRIMPSSMPVPDIEDIKYPYGLRISLEKEDIDKLGIDISKFGIGNKINITAIAEVENIRQNKNTRNEDQCVGLQIIKMDIKKRTTLKDV